MIISRVPQKLPLRLSNMGITNARTAVPAHPVIKFVLGILAPRLRFVYRHFPLTQIHPHAEAAAETAEFAGTSGKYWAMHDAIFENQGWLDLPLLLSLAGILGLSDRRLSGRVCDDSYRLLPLEQKAPKIDDRHGQLAPTAPSYCVGLVLPYRLALDWKVLQLAPAFWGQRAPVTQTKIQEVIMNRTDREIEGYVKDELQWSPDLDSGDVAVSVKQGVITLTGFVRSYLDKYEAEAAAKRVAGVTAVANDIEVRLPGVDQRPDPEIARDAVASIKTQLPVSWEQIQGRR
jgi:hypothetical protein